MTMEALQQRYRDYHARTTARSILVREHIEAAYALGGAEPALAALARRMLADSAACSDTDMAAVVLMNGAAQLRHLSFLLYALAEVKPHVDEALREFDVDRECHI